MTFWVNFILLHTGATLSSKMRFPALGAFGSINRAGTSLRAFQQAFNVAARVHRVAVTAEKAASCQLKGVSTLGRSYIML